MSDLHLEFIKSHKIEKFLKNIPLCTTDDILVLAGDIGNPYSTNYDTFMKFVSKNFAKTFVIAGNHEYYNKIKTIKETTLFLEEYLTQFHNISFLNNSYEEYRNMYFVGTILWSKVDVNTPYHINDLYAIPDMSCSVYNKLHNKSVSFLQETLGKVDKDKSCVVITHHLPSDSLVDDKYKTQKLLPYSQWFSSNQDTLIETHKNKIKLWIYGHTHTASQKTVHTIPFLCNPLGYPMENTKYDYEKVIDIAV